MSNFFRKEYKRLYAGVKRNVFFVLYLFFIAFLLPENILAAESTQTAKPPAAIGVTFWLLLICYWNRKKPIGGWLLYYFITLFVGSIMSIILIFFTLTLSNFNPMNWENKSRYFLYIITTVPGYVFLLSQILLSYYLLSEIRRDWKHIQILRKILLADFIFSVFYIPIEITYWSLTGSTILNGFSAMVSLIWYFYFKKSIRVKCVFKDKAWNWEMLFASKKKVIENVIVGNKTKDVQDDDIVRQRQKELYKQGICPQCGDKFDLKYTKCFTCDFDFYENKLND